MTIPVLYEAPVMLEKNRFSEIVCRELHIDAPAPDMTEWDAMLESIRSRSHRVTIGLVGKYVQLHDAYLSGEAADGARKLDDRDLHTQADTEIGDVVRASVVRGRDLALDAAVAEAAGHENAVAAAEHFLYKNGGVLRHAGHLRAPPPPVRVQ